MSTRSTYIAGYDLESIQLSLKALEVVVKVHRTYNIPATFFVVGQLLEKDSEKYRTLLENDLFDIQSHTYSHKLLKNSLVRGGAPSLEVIEEEIVKANKLLKTTFGREIVGLRAPGGFDGGLRGERKVLSIMWREGIRFISSDLRGPFDTIPGPLTQPYWYKEDGFSNLLELPGHDWHDNVLKGYTQLITTWPPIFPWGLPSKVPQTPEEVFEVYRPSIDYAIKNNLTYYSPIFHPWSIYRCSKSAKTVDLLLRYVKKQGMPTFTYLQMYEKLRKEKRGR